MDNPIGMAFAFLFVAAFWTIAIGVYVLIAVAPWIVEPQVSVYIGVPWTFFWGALIVGFVGHMITDRR